MEIKIGDYSATYALYKTSAPKDYDGYGTLEIYKGVSFRFVMVQNMYCDWQLARYGSGPYFTEIVAGQRNDAIMQEALVKKLLA